MAEPTFDHERLDVYRLSIDYVAFSSMLTRLIQRTAGVSEGSIEYEYEYEYEPTAERPF